MASRDRPIRCARGSSVSSSSICISDATGSDRDPAGGPAQRLNPAGGEAALCLTVEARLRRAASEQQDRTAGTRPVRIAPPILALVKAIARGHVWFDELARGEALSVAQIATREGVTDRYVSCLLKLAFVGAPIVDEVRQRAGEPSGLDEAPHARPRSTPRVARAADDCWQQLTFNQRVLGSVPARSPMISMYLRWVSESPEVAGAIARGWGHARVTKRDRDIDLFLPPLSFLALQGETIRRRCRVRRLQRKSRLGLSGSKVRALVHPPTKSKGGLSG